MQLGIAGGPEVRAALPMGAEGRGWKDAPGLSVPHAAHIAALEGAHAAQLEKAALQHAQQLGRLEEELSDVTARHAAECASLERRLLQAQSARYSGEGRWTWLIGNGRWTWLTVVALAMALMASWRRRRRIALVEGVV